MMALIHWIKPARYVHINFLSETPLNPVLGIHPEFPLALLQLTNSSCRGLYQHHNSNTKPPTILYKPPISALSFQPICCTRTGGCHIESLTNINLLINANKPRFISSAVGTSRINSFRQTTQHRCYIILTHILLDI